MGSSIEWGRSCKMSWGCDLPITGNFVGVCLCAMSLNISFGDVLRSVSRNLLRIS